MGYQSTAEGDSYRTIVEDLLRVCNADMEITFKPEYRDVADIAFGWLLQVRYGVQAIITLEEAGLTVVTSPLRRLVIEHLVALKWVVCDGEAVIDPLTRSMHHGIGKIQKAIEKVDWAALDTSKIQFIANAAAEADKSSDYLLQFMSRANRVEALHDIVAYLSETSYSHPSLETMGVFMPGAEGRKINQYGFCALYLFEACCQFDDLLSAAEWDQELESLDDRMAHVSGANTT